RPEGPGKLSPLAPYLPPLQAPAAGPFPHFVGDKVHRFVPRSEARGEGASAKRGRGRPEGPGKPVSHLASFTHAYRIIERNLRVRWCLGLVRISAGRPSSTTTPASMNTTRSATSRAKPISWVTTIIVIPSV